MPIALYQRAKAIALASSLADRGSGYSTSPGGEPKPSSKNGKRRRPTMKLSWSKTVLCWSGYCRNDCRCRHDPTQWSYPHCADSHSVWTLWRSSHSQAVLHELQASQAPDKVRERQNRGDNQGFSVQRSTLHLIPFPSAMEGRRPGWATRNL